MSHSKRDLDEVRRALLDRQAELEDISAISSAARAAVTLDQSSVGRVSRIDALQQQQLALATERQRERDIQRIKAALVRIDDGQFGYCLTCGEPIADQRLRLDPAVATCIACAR